MESLLNKFVTTLLAVALGTFLGLMSFMATMVIIDFIW